MIDSQNLPAMGTRAADRWENADALPGAVEADIDTAARPAFRLLVTPEVVLYIVFFVVAVVLRLPEIDTITLNAGESREALAALRTVVPDAPGSPLVTRYPLMFAANTLAVGMGGAENATVRFPTLLVGALLSLSPLLFRRWLGPVQSLILSAIFALSPVLLVASRRMDGAVWSAALAVLIAAWALRFAQTRRASYALAATVAMVLLALGTEPAGFLTLLGLFIGAGFAYLSTDDPNVRRIALLALRGWPWRSGLVVAVAALFVIGTVFLAAPQAMAGIGESLGAGLRGISVGQPGFMGAFPLLVSLVYEPVLWLFGLAGAFLILTIDPESDLRLTDAGRTQLRQRLFLGRALLGWLIASVAWSLVYAGPGPGHALWLTLPLAGLASFAIAHTLAPVRDPHWHIPAWGPWLHALVLVAVLFIGGINVVMLGRAVLAVSPALTPPLDQPDLMKMLMAMLAFALAVVTFFLAGSVWGARGALQGIGLGLLVFLTLYSFNVGWQAAVSKANDPRELWNLHPPAPGIARLEQTMRTASLRATGSPTSIEVAVLLPPGMDDSGTIAWTLRHFRNVRYVDALTPRIATPAVIAPATDTMPPLGADYVGQDFTTFTEWDRGSMTYWDFLPWLYDRQVRIAPRNEGKVVVYLRADVYGLSSGAQLPGAGGQ